eukprot:TRINITY_DN47501_c0_g1_i1.p1 TRINITY_DN47501_c0_g1~~TRINITY_DN47501_c0_g1_i1.p1  ORF type:complete len:718 (-),score=140.08 TRINITY_DN47501_c0_g1_i1:180-2333(-)
MKMLHHRARAVRAVFLLGSLVLVPGYEYSKSYTFMADRSVCDGQCNWCRNADVHNHWAEIKSTMTRYVYRPSNLEVGEYQSAAVGVKHLDIQNLIAYSWDSAVEFNCITGIIALRMLSYGYTDPMAFTDNDVSVLEWLDVLNAHTGALDMLTSEWAGLVQGGWPVFQEFLLISRKVRDRLEDKGMYPKMQDRPNECDALDTEADIEYRQELLRHLQRNSLPLAGNHMVALQRGMGCPVGAAVALLALAVDMVYNRGTYLGSLKSVDNLLLGLISTAQDAVAVWAKNKMNWSPFFDLLTTEWPLWELLSKLSCVDSNKPCATRHRWQCYDMVRRQEVPCPHEAPTRTLNFVTCGEHDICTKPQSDALRPDGFDMEAWCLPFDKRVVEPRQPWLLKINHDAEERICTQCGQDGVLRFIFDHIGFRDAAGPEGSGGSPPYFVEFGARKPGMLNSAALRTFCGWRGLLMDGQPGETPHGGCPGCPGVADLVQKEFVTAENVVELFQKHAVPSDFDLLTIDTDYNDYWIWRALLQDGTFRPRVVAVDFNPDFPLDQAKVVEYAPEAEWDGSVYTVASLLAYALLARAHGYVFAYALEMGAHAFFIRGDLLAAEDQNLPLRGMRKMSHPPDAAKRQFVDVLYDFMPSNASGGNEAPGASEEVVRLRQEVQRLTALELQRLQPRSDPPRQPNDGEGRAFSDGVGGGSAASSFYKQVRDQQNARR